MKQPPRRFQRVQLYCQDCGESIKAGEFGGWAHIRRIGIRDPRWHRAMARYPVNLDRLRAALGDEP